jgi:cobalt/nickel transport protein
VTRRRLVDVALLVGIVALFAVPLAAGWGLSGRAPADVYSGTDNAAVSAVERTDPGYRPWFEPLFRPSSPSVESGLFALQAALGAGGLGFVLGRLSGRRGAERAASAKDGGGSSP